MNYIYEIRQSNKGWSASYCFTFEEQLAQNIIKEIKDSGTSKNNFRVIKHECYYPKDIYFSLHQEFNVCENEPF